MARLETRVARIAEAFLAERRSVRPIDVLVGLGWLAQPNVDRWVLGRVLSLDRCVGIDSDKVMAALAALQHWAEDRGLKSSEADYRDLNFTADGDSDAERAYRTHWASADIPEAVVERPRRPGRIIVISPHNAWTCASCGDTGDLLVKEKAGALCLDCADLGHLEFLPSGDAALTRRATKASRLSAVVVRWSTRRNRYERQGILAEAAAIEQAAQECLSDADVRARRRTPCPCRVSTANRLEHKCTSVTSSTPGATVLRCSTDSRHTGRGHTLANVGHFALDAVSPFVNVA